MNDKPSGMKPSASQQCKKLSAIELPASRQGKGFLGLFRSVLVMFLILSIAETAAAKSVTVENYLKHRNAFKNYHVSWLDGVFNGLRGANAELHRTNKAMLFCPPADFSMSAPQVNAFFDKFIASHRDKVAPSDPIGALLLQALMEAYPCP